MTAHQLAHAFSLLTVCLGCGPNEPAQVTPPNVDTVEQQTPVGSWTATDDAASIKLVFEGGPSEGIYKQIIESGGKTIREFGHWAVQLNALKMLIMATDVHPHARFGIDTTYQIKYVGPDSIRIEGPDRPNLIFTRAEDMTIDFGPDETTDSADNS